VPEQLDRAVIDHVPATVGIVGVDNVGDSSHQRSATSDRSKGELHYVRHPPSESSATRSRARSAVGVNELLSRVSRLKRERGITLSACVPTLNEEETIVGVCREITTLRGRGGLVDELVVIDSGSDDDTVHLARAEGATALLARELAPAGQPNGGGKGEAMWKSLSAVNGDIIVWLDADVVNFSAGWLPKLSAPLLTSEALLTKAFYRRPLLRQGDAFEEGGGRVTELVARPLINALWPALAYIRQPLAGECAGFTSLLRKMPFLTGYAVELGLLVAFAERHGDDRIAQVDLGVRLHRNRPLHELARTSFEIIHGAALLLEDEGRTGDLRLSPTLVQQGSAHRVDVHRLPPREVVDSSSASRPTRSSPPA
jgi:glucosyl-3-phosphoglycerate synthase